MKMDTLEAGRKASSRRQSQGSAARSKSTQNRARSSSRKTSKATARRTSRSGQRRGSAKVTTDLEEIRQWAEARGGKPVSVIGTSPRNRAGLLRIDFPGYSGAGRFEEVSWEDWYGKFQESNLEFLYQDRTKDGEESRFFKLVCRGTAKGSGSRAKSQGQSRSRSRSGAQARGGSRSGSRNRARR
jgi:hypothetical protein